jgi:fructose-1-phosphate kinase PfkB-like protein
MESTVVNQMAKEQIADLCARTRAKFVMVTRGSRAMSFRDGVMHRFSAPTTDRSVSSTRAGDALLGGLVAYWFKEHFWLAAFVCCRRTVCT